jgi:hypothetical protein
MMTPISPPIAPVIHAEAFPDDDAMFAWFKAARNESV